MLITFALFVGALSTGIVGLIVGINAPAKKPIQTIADEESIATVFYKTIGQAPSLEKASPQRRPDAATFTLEIKVAERRDEAEKVIDMLKELGIKAYYTPLNRGGKVVYRIRHGIFTSAKKAHKASTHLRVKKQVANRVSKL